MEHIIGNAIERAFEALQTSIWAELDDAVQNMSADRVVLAASMLKTMLQLSRDIDAIMHNPKDE